MPHLSSFSSLRAALAALLLSLLTLAAAPLAAQQPQTPPEEEEAAASEAAVDEAEAELDEAESELEETVEEAADRVTGKQTAHGSAKWRPSYGAGLEVGLWFVEFDRWNSRLLGPNEQALFDSSLALNVDLAIEASLVPLTRLTLFGGIQRAASSDPSISALYIGIEPALAHRQGRWEIAVGSGFGLGRTDLELEADRSASATLFLIRPFLEGRVYVGNYAAFYLRGGFNYWNQSDLETDGLSQDDLLRPGQGPDASSNLNEGGAYLALGARFGHYPPHLVVVEDTDADGLRDDVDECPEQPEDIDTFQDADGCPDPDNDADGVPDATDQCPLVPEDIDTFEDEDGCPDPDNDADGVLDVADKCPLEPGKAEREGCPDRDPDQDGIMNEADKCPNDPEDKDGFEDEDGCPDPDNDKDGLPDEVDQCPNEAETYNGNKDEDGCPDGKQTVVITETEIRILERVFFDTGKATIKPVSFTLLDTVAGALRQNPKITLLRIEGHTDDVGRDESNMELSKERAASVKEYLEGKGIGADRLDSEGFGETKPLCDEMPELLKNKRRNREEIEECRATNRRVQFKILEVNGEKIDASESVTIEEKSVIEEPIPGAADAPTDDVPADAP